MSLYSSSSETESFFLPLELLFSYSGSAKGLFVVVVVVVVHFIPI